MKRPKNKEGQGDQDDLNEGNEFQNDPETLQSAKDENGNEEAYEKTGKHGAYNDYDSHENTDQESDEEGEGEYAYEEEQEGKGGFDIKKIAQKVKDYIKGESGTFDQETIVKYISVAIVAIYGIRKGGLIGSLLLSVAAGLVTKYLLETEGAAEKGQEQEQEEGVEFQPA